MTDQTEIWFRGKPIVDMTRDELLDALTFCAIELDKAHSEVHRMLFGLLPTTPRKPQEVALDMNEKEEIMRAFDWAGGTLLFSLLEPNEAKTFHAIKKFAAPRDALSDVLFRRKVMTMSYDVMPAGTVVYETIEGELGGTRIELARRTCRQA